MSIHDFTIKATDFSGAIALSAQRVELLNADPLFANVKLLLHFDEPSGATNVLDEKSNYFSKQGSAVIVDTSAAFGNSGYLNGSSSSWAAQMVSADAIGTSDFCLECFIQPDSDCPDSGLFGFSTASDFNTRCIVRMYPESGGFRFQASMQNSTSSTFVTSAVLTIPTDSFTHVALTRASGMCRLFVNGVLVGNVTSTLNHTATNIRIGMVYSGSVNRYFKGHIDECRYTKGAARYAAAFVPPSGPFPNA